MDIVVCVKKIPNVSQLMPHPETGAPQLDLVPSQLSDFDENALEAAVRLKEERGGNVTLLTASPSDPKDVLSKALAMGADGAVAVVDEAVTGLDSFGLSIILAACIRRHVPRFDLVLCGEGSVDDYSCQVGPRLAEQLSIPCITFVTELLAPEATLRAKRVLENRAEQVSCETPVLITVGMEINKPRHVSLLRIMAASARPIKMVSLSDLGLIRDALTGLTTLKVSAPRNLRKRHVLEGSAEEVSRRLVTQLVEDGVITD